MSELKPCPFCGGEPTAIETHPGRGELYCGNCDVVMGGNNAMTPEELTAAWNTRAAYEMDGWFYLPKPKQQLFSYTTGFSFDDLSLKATGTIDVYAMTSAVQKWQEEALNAQIVERICEVFKPERTCEPLGTIRYDYEGGYAGFEYETELSCGHKWRDSYGDYPDYCPTCGARVVGE